MIEVLTKLGFIGSSLELRTQQALEINYGDFKAKSR